jgi:hypothetical protein
MFIFTMVTWDLMELRQQVLNLTDIGRRTRVVELCQSLTKAFEQLML